MSTEGAMPATSGAASSFSHGFLGAGLDPNGFADYTALLEHIPAHTDPRKRPSQEETGEDRGEKKGMNSPGPAGSCPESPPHLAQASPP